MPTAHLNGIDVYFERNGSGRPLLFLNVSGATLASAALLLDPFSKAADTVAADQRGLGQTGETYLVGPDYWMRSDARGFLETPENGFRRRRRPCPRPSI